MNEIQCPAKINLGLNVVERRPDGYHNLETIFIPVPLYDKLGIEEQPADSTHQYPCQLSITGDDIECEEQKNLVVKAYNLLAADFNLPRVHAHLEKHIPSQAGMGGGSSDAAYMIKLLNEKYTLDLTEQQMEAYAAKLGADCAFFIKAVPSYAEGIGDKLYPIPGIAYQLKGLRLALVKPHLAISTREAFAEITPRHPSHNCVELAMQPLETWKEMIVNDFEASVFPKHLELDEIKRTLYRMGALYSAMSGSGSTIYAFFPSDKTVTTRQLRKIFPECFTHAVTL